MLFGEGLGIAEHGRERGSKLMTRVGDEIDPHLLGRHRIRAVDHPNQHQLPAEMADDQPPRAAKLGNAGDVDLARSVGKDPFERLRMADREADIAPFDAAAEQLARRRVGKADDAAFDDQRRLVERIDQGAFGKAAMSAIAARVADCSASATPGKEKSPSSMWTRGPPFEPRGAMTERRIGSP